MAHILEGQLSALDLLGMEPAPSSDAPPFQVNVSAWQPRGCGWCQKVNTIGGAAIRHPEHHNISLYYEYCEKCVARYGDPRRSPAWPQFRVNEQPGPETEKVPQILERIATWRALTTKEAA